MSSDLVQRLRFKMKIFRICQEAADRIEALQAEVAKVKASAKKFFDDAGAITKNADQELEDMADALRVTLDAKNAAEARAERLRLALEEIKRDPVVAVAVAERALEGGA